MTAMEAIVYTGCVSTLAGLLFLLGLHRSGKIDLVDVVTDPDAKGVRRASIRKIGEATALGTTTFVLVLDAAADGSVNEWVFLAYVGAWVSRTLIGMVAQAKAGAIAAAAGK